MKKIIAVLITSTIPFQIMADASMNEYLKIRATMDGSGDNDYPVQAQGDEQRKALERLIDYRSEPYKVYFWGLDILATRYRKDPKRVRAEVDREVREGSLQYKSGFAYGWHAVAGAPVDYGRAIFLAPFGLLFGIASMIATADGWL